jgi:hypothetical protein
MSKTTDASSLSRRALLATAAAGVTVLAVSLFATLVAAQDLNTGVGTLDGNSAEKVFPAKPLYSPYAGRKFPTRPFFGDTHLHTAASFDAGAFGARLGPREALPAARK